MSDGEERVTHAFHTEADSGQLDAHAVPLGLMVRSRDLGPTPIRSLVRGVSNIASRVYPTCAHLKLISGKPEISGRPILRDGRYARIAFLGSVCTCALLRMRRIKADRGQSRLIVKGRFTGANQALKIFSASPDCSSSSSTSSTNLVKRGSSFLIAKPAVRGRS